MSKNNMMTRRELLSVVAVSAAAAAALRSPAAPLPASLYLPAFSALSGRPEEAERRFRSPVIERVIAQMRGSLASPELARIFENCFPNTLDTTVFQEEVKVDGKPDTYVITGDIDAMWLRDSSAQVWPYLPFVKEDPALARLIEGVIRRQGRLIQIDPYANAFTRRPTDPALPWAVHDKTEMRPGVAERKWEIDSLCFPVRLAYGFWKATNSTTAFDAEWLKTAKLIVATFREQQRTNGRGGYRFQRSAPAATDTLPLNGYGNPVRPNGLICSAFRPSDDACIYLFNIPANLFAIVTLERLAEMAAAIYSDHALATECLNLAKEVRAAVLRHGVVRHPAHGEILAYEIDGFGNTLLMDDANAPGLVSLAYLDLVAQSSALYVRTRAFALSTDNPYFFRGKAGEGIGGPHVGMDYIWPMSIIMRALTSESDAEVVQCLRTLCATTAQTNFMHEAFQKDDAAKYTRPWFAWANGLFGELLLQLQRQRPALLRNFRVSS